MTMARKPKQPKTPCKIKPYVSQNLHILMNMRYPGLSATEQAIKMGKAVGKGKSTIIRLRNPYDHTITGIDVIEALAEHLRVEPFQLLKPHFARDMLENNIAKKRKR